MSPRSLRAANPALMGNGVSQTGTSTSSSSGHLPVKNVLLVPKLLIPLQQRLARLLFRFNYVRCHLLLGFCANSLFLPMSSDMFCMKFRRWPLGGLGPPSSAWRVHPSAPPFYVPRLPALILLGGPLSQPSSQYTVGVRHLVYRRRPMRARDKCDGACETDHSRAEGAGSTGRGHIQGLPKRLGSKFCTR